MNYKIGDKFIVNTSNWGLYSFYGQVKTIIGYCDNTRRWIFTNNWYIHEEDMLPLTPLIEALL